MHALGIIESKHIASGIKLTDSIVKAADVELLKAATICSGRFLILVCGAVAAVQTAVDTAIEAKVPLLGAHVIAHMAPQLLAHLQGKAGQTKQSEGRALAVVECRSPSSGIYAVDAALKQSHVSLPKLVLGQGINGKSYFIMQGDIASLQEALHRAQLSLGKNLITSELLPNPDQKVLQHLIKPTSRILS